MICDILIPLLDEGTNVWRPAKARKIAENIYFILLENDYDADDECWEFPPGSTVLCELQKLQDGEFLVAVAHKH